MSVISVFQGMYVKRLLQTESNPTNDLMKETGEH